MLRLIGIVLPLGLDALAVSVALGLAGLPARERLRASLLLPGFEVGLPLLGVAAGGLLGRLLGGAAEAIAIAVLAGVGLLLLRDGGDEAGWARSLAEGRWLPLLALGLAVGLDELALGLTIGLLGLPLLPALLLIAVQGVVLVQVGLRLGARLGEPVREWAERLAGLLLIGLALALAAEELLGEIR